MRDLLKQGLSILLFVILLLLLVPCLLQCFQSCVERSINAVFKKKGGGVGALAVLNDYTEL